MSAVPFVLMRGGTSRGPYLRRADLPEDQTALEAAVLRMVGAESPLCIDGIGGGSAVTTKVAMLSPGTRGADVDFLFAQLTPGQRFVDMKPSCGNILAGVAPAAIELGLIAAGQGETRVLIHAVNTGGMIEAVVQTPGGQVRYEGDETLPGVPGSAAPILLDFLDAVGSGTGALLPTGQAREVIQGVEVTCLDIAMPVVIARAADLGMTALEPVAALDGNRAFLDRIEAIRLEAGRRMGLGDVARSVTPKFAMVAPAVAGGSLAARYFMPWACHPSMAVTGGQCIAASALLPGTVSEGLVPVSDALSVDLGVEHPQGILAVRIGLSREGGQVGIRSAGVRRTARLIARGALCL